MVREIAEEGLGHPATLDATLFQQMDMEQAEIQSAAAGIAAVLSARAPGKETPNEDAAAVFHVGDTSAVLLVADGVGGLPSGELAAALALQEIEKTLLRSIQEGMRLRNGVLNGIESANQAIQQLGAATTLVALEIEGETVRPYHVGDSAVLVVGLRGRIKWQTVAHSPVGHAVEAGLLDEEEAMQHEDRYLISNFVGSPEMRIEVGPSLRLAQYDTVLLATDGIFDNLHVQEIIDRVRRGPLAKAAKALGTDSRRRMLDPAEGEPSKADDATFILYRRKPKRRARARSRKPVV